MSQVRKLQTGGKFRMNGRELSGQTAIDRLAAVYSGLPLEEREMFTVAQNAVKNGDTAEYDPTNNTITVTDSEGNNVTSKYTDTTASVKDSKFKRNWGATFNTRTHRFKKSGEAMALVDMTDPNEVKKEEPSKTALRRGSGWFDYDTDEQGNSVYRENGPGNIDRMKVLDEGHVYFGQDPSVTKDTYTTNGWSDANLTALRNFYATLGDEAGRNSYLEGLKERIRSGKITAADEETLNLFGFSKNGQAAGAQQQQQQSQNGPSIPSDWKGNREAAIKAGVGLEFKDGHWYLTGDSDYATQNWYNGGIDFLKGTGFENGFIVNRRLYTENEAMNPGSDTQLRDTLAPFISSPRDNWRAWYDSAANSGIRFLGDRNGQSSDFYGNFATQYNPSADYNETWYKYFSQFGPNKTFDINDLTNYYNTSSGEGLGNRQILSYIDPSSYRKTGVFNPKFVVYDPSNTANPYTMFNSENDMLSNLGLVASPYGTTRKLNFNPWTTIRGKDYAVHTEFGEPGRENTIFTDREGNYYVARNGDRAKPVLIKDKELLGQILQNPSKYTNSDIIDKLAKTPKTEEQKRSDEMYGISEYNGHNFLFEEGGELNKFQYGGTLNQSKNEVSSKSTSEAKTDVTKAHALDGSDGGLTTAEWMQIGAAIGDLAGVGLSFVPGAGNIAGAATGAASSTTRFAADIKQDGFQGKDLLNYAGNLVLDAATLIPVIGTGAKAAKAAKIIKSVGKPLIKVLSLAGASAPVITAVTKIANGEKYTSADLAQAIQGIGSGIIATKSIKDSIGNAKLAQKIAGKSVDAANASLNTARTASAGGFKMERTPAQLEAFVKSNPTEAKALESVKAFAKNEKIDLSDADAKKILTDLGIQFDKGKIHVNLKAGFKKGFHTRGETTTSFEAPTPETTKSWLHFALSPKARANVFGSEAVYGFKTTKGPKRFRQVGQVAENISPAEIISAINAKRPNLTQQAILRMTAENPQAFGNMFRQGSFYKPSEYRKGVYFGGRRYYRNPAITDSSRLLIAPAGGNPVNVRYGRPITALTVYQSPYRLTAPNPIAEEFRLPWNPPVGRRFHLTGNSASSGVIITPYTKALPYYQGAIQLPEHFKAGGKIQKFQSGGFTGKGVNINWANLDDLMRAGVAARAIYKDRDIRRNALGELKKRQFITPHIDQLRYNFSDIDQSYNDQALPLLESTFVTSDSRDSMGFKLAKAQNLSRLANQKNAAISQRMAAIDEQNRQIESTNAVNEAETANQKSQYLTGLEYQDKMLDSEALNRVFSDVINPLGQQFGQQGRDAFNRKVDTNYRLEMADADKLENARISGDLNSKGYTAKWNALTPQERSQYSDISDYVYSQNPDDWKAIYSRSKAYQNNVNNAVDTYTRATGPLVFYKKGGNLRSAQEQIAINAAKQAQQSTAKLSDNLMKMLQQLTK